MFSIENVHFNRCQQESSSSHRKNNKNKTKMKQTHGHSHASMKRRKKKTFRWVFLSVNISSFSFSPDVSYDVRWSVEIVLNIFGSFFFFHFIFRVLMPFHTHTTHTYKQTALPNGIWAVKCLRNAWHKYNLWD